MMTGSLIIMLKAPAAGRVKTRLAAEIGVARATALYRVMLHQTFAAANMSGVRTVLAIDPPAALGSLAGVWPVGFERMAQRGGDLGARMTGAIEDVARRRPAPIVLIGADAAGLRARHIRAAFAALKGADAVFGPARDGGYWLIGLARRYPAPDLFAGVRWSSAHALADTKASLPAHFRLAALETLTDIDHATDLSALALLSTGAAP